MLNLDNLDVIKMLIVQIKRVECKVKFPVER